MTIDTSSIIPVIPNSGLSGTNALEGSSKPIDIAKEGAVSSEAQESVYIKSLGDLRIKNEKMYNEMMKAIAQKINSQFKKSADRIKAIRKNAGY